MNNIQKNFKAKSSLRCMADGGVVDQLSGKSREQQLQEAVGNWHAASAPPAGQPDFRNVQAAVKSTEQTVGERPKSALQKFFGMADGGLLPEKRAPGAPAAFQAAFKPPTAGATSQTFTSTNNGVKSYTDAAGAGAGATKFDPGTLRGASALTATPDANAQAFAARAQHVFDKPPVPVPPVAPAVAGVTPAVAPAVTPAATSAIPPVAQPSVLRASSVPAPPPPSFAPAPILQPPPVEQFASAQQPNFFALADGGAMKDKIKEGPDGAVRGPGGPTEDKVGPVMLSSGEYVLPADTVDHIGKENLDALRHATHRFKGGDADDVQGMANGGYLDSLKKFGQDALARGQEAFSALRAPAAPPVAAAPAAAPSPFRVNPGAGVDSRVGQAARELAPVSEIAPGRGMVPYQAPVAPTALGRAANMAGRVARTGLRIGEGVAATAPLAGFGDYKADVGPGVDTSFRGTVNHVQAAALSKTWPEFKDNMGKAGMSLSGGAGEALVDSGRGFAKTGDYLAGVVSAKPGLTQGYDKMIADNLGGYMTLRNPDFSNVTGGSRSTELAPGEVSKTPVADALTAARSNSRMANEVPTGKGDTAGVGYQGMVENRSGQSNAAISGADPNSFYAKQADDAIIGSRNGKNMTKREADARAAGLSTASGMGAREARDPLTEALTSALRGGGGGAYNSPATDTNAKAIMERYDKISAEMAGRYSSKGQGNLTKHQLELEQQRSSALDANARVGLGARGQDVSAGSSAASNRTQMAGIAASALRGREQDKASNAKIIADAQARQQEALGKAGELSAKAQQQGFTNFNKIASDMFAGDENPAASQEGLKKFVMATDPTYLKEQAGVASMEDLFSLPPQEMAVATQKLRTMAEMQQVANLSRGDDAPTSDGFEAPDGMARQSNIGDVFGDTAYPMADWAKGFITPGDDMVQPLAGGSVVNLRKYLGNSQDKAAILNETRKKPKKD